MHKINFKSFNQSVLLELGSIAIKKLLLPETSSCHAA